jgi:hypothetical protein
MDRFFSLHPQFIEGVIHEFSYLYLSLVKGNPIDCGQAECCVSCYIIMENQISVKCTYIESIHNMRKPVISSEISPKLDGVPTTDILPYVVSTPNPLKL